MFPYILEVVKNQPAIIALFCLAAFRKVLTVRKDELLKEEARLRAEKQKKREAKKPH